MFLVGVYIFFSDLSSLKEIGEGWIVEGGSAVPKQPLGPEFPVVSARGYIRSSKISGT